MAPGSQPEEGIMILIAYDGSEDSKSAITHAGTQFPDQHAIVLTVWQRFVDTMARAGAGLAVVVDYDEIDENAEQVATERAAEGTEIAQRSGFDAEPRIAMVQSTVAAAIISEASELDADAIVVGTRGLTGVKSVLLGSTSHGVVQHADRPVMIIPSPKAVAARAKHHAHHVEENRNRHLQA